MIVQSVNDVPRTPDDIFNHIAEHLLTQGCKAYGMVGEVIGCFYRGENGTACAAGSIIPDSHYKQTYEGTLFCSSPRSNNDVYYKLLKDDYPILSKSCLYLIDELQRVHDDCTVENWPQTLTSLAFEYKINISSKVQELLAGNKHGV